MDNHDKIFEKIKNASLNQQAPDFASMDKVWSRVESKLDNKLLKKENKLWKKIAIAASFLLVFTVSYEVFKPAKEIAIPTNKTAAIDSVITATPTIIKKSEAVAIVPEPNPIIKKNPARILNEQISSSSETVAANDAITVEPESEMAVPEPVKPSISAVAAKDADDENRKPGYIQGNVYEAKSVKREESSNYEYKKSARSKVSKSPPLMVIDGKAQTTKDEKGNVQQGLSGLDPDDIKDIVVLQEPLYIINGSYYSEQELFGPNPTSPYHPLNQQEIEELSILQGEKAIAAYGKKGEKGVVIITTKNGKPVKASKRTEP